MERTDLASFLGIASGVLVTLILICIGVGLTARSRNNGGVERVSGPVNAAAGDDKKKAPVDSPQDQDRYDMEDDNPDLIPDNLREYHFLVENPVPFQQIMENGPRILQSHRTRIL